MPNQPSPDKCHIGIRVPRELKRAVAKAAKERKMTISEFVAWILQRETQNIELTADDYREIARQTENASRRYSSAGDTDDGRRAEARKARKR